MWYLAGCGQNGDTQFFMYCAFLQLSVSEEPEPQLYINSDGIVVKKLQLNSQHCLKCNQSLLSICLGFLRPVGTPQIRHLRWSAILRRDQKKRKHFCFKGPYQTVPDVGEFYDECEHEICPSGTSGMLEFVFSCYQSLIFNELSIINV